MLNQLNLVLTEGKLFIDAKGTTKIGEFGLAALCDPFSSFVPSVSLSGLVRWLSPELLDMDLDSEVKPTTASDIWALGCVFLEVCGVHLTQVERTNNAWSFRWLDYSGNHPLFELPA